VSSNHAQAMCTRYNIKVCQWLAAGWWFSPDTAVSPTNKTDRHDINEILLQVALNTINPLPINIYGGSDALVWQYCSESLFIEFII
jgi:hypothetical protein